MTGKSALIIFLVFAADGTFSFTSSDTGQQKIIIAIMGYKKFAMEVFLVSKPISISAILKEAITEMDAVTVSAGSFEASNRKRSSLLKPLDILTTAGQQADNFHTSSIPPAKTSHLTSYYT